MTPEHQSAARERLAKRTPGEWGVYLGSATAPCIWSDATPDRIVAECRGENDALFIARSPADLTAALDHISALESELAALRGIFERDHPYEGV